MNNDKLKSVRLLIVLAKTGLGVPTQYVKEAEEELNALLDAEPASKPDEGQVISIDVSTGEDDHADRIFAYLTGETIPTEEGDIWLAEELSRNFFDVPERASKPEHEQPEQMREDAVKECDRLYREEGKNYYTVSFVAGWEAHARRTASKSEGMAVCDHCQITHDADKIAACTEPRCATRCTASDAPAQEPIAWTEQAALTVLNMVGDGPYGTDDVIDALAFLKASEIVRANIVSASPPAQPAPATEPLLLCKLCGTDRAKDRCPRNGVNCGISGHAQIQQWCESDEGKAALKNAIAEASADIARLNEARKIDPADLHVPMDAALKAQPAAPMTDEEILRIFYDEIEGEGFALYEVTPGNMIAFARRLLGSANTERPAAADVDGLLVGLQPLETVQYWAAEFPKDPQRLAGGMIIKLLNEYAQLRGRMANTPAACSTVGQVGSANTDTGGAK